MATSRNYRSKLEKVLGEGVLKDCHYEPFTLSYTQTKEYLPDFVTKESGYIFEAKGYFRTYGEFKKYVDVQRDNPFWELVFIFQDPEKPLPWSRKRKGDGKRMTHRELVEKHGFQWCTPYTVKKEWL